MNSARRAAAKPGQRGAVTVLVAMMLTVLLGFCALALDLAFAYVVRNELQNAADAAALSGAANLFNQSATPAAAPDWSAATLAAEEAITLNQSSRVALQVATALPGYWSMDGATGELQSLPATPGPADAPAVMVTVRRADGENGGPVPLFFARALGIDSMPVAAFAVAAVAPPGAVGAGALFPLAVSACLYRAYWDAGANPPGPKTDSATGLPYVFRIGPGYDYASCLPGTWSSFQDDAGTVSGLQALMSAGNPALLKAGAAIWMQTAADNALFAAVDACSARGSRQCETAIAVVVENVGSHAQDTVIGFACLRIELASFDGDNYVQAVMSRHCKVGNAGGVGPNYGALATPRLVR